ncbi:MAG: hypothetical protein E6R03_15485 [Hyphomicrobiaceae bacterium]|nr:MAG: hypothetical protein E6R03_15485 [Hyphomicrobiaceae bacterium]
MEKVPDIAGLLAMSDDELLDTFGFRLQIESIKDDLAQMAELKGAAREEAERRIAEMFTPDVSDSQIRWVREDVVRQSKRSKSAALSDDSPSSVLE